MHTYRDTHSQSFNDLLCFLASYLCRSEILVSYVSMDVALCHSSGAGKPFGCHGSSPITLILWKIFWAPYKPWNMPFGLLEVEEIP